jgi:Xaa-Pro aminopeptidase
VLNDIDDLMAKHEIDALFLAGKSLLNPDLYYTTRFLTVDEFYYVKVRDQSGVIAAPDLICERARKYSPIKDFHSVSPVRSEAVQERVSSDEIDFRVVSDIHKHLLPKSGTVGVPRNIDALHVYHLHKLGVSTQPVQSLFHEARETKDESEIQAIKKASKATEATFHKVFDIIQNCEIGSKRQLLHKGKPLTVGTVKQVIQHALVDNNSENTEAEIVAGGTLSADYHYLGEPSDILHAHEPIIIDIYPRRITERYHADITRTLVRGAVPKELKNLIESVQATIGAVIDAISPENDTETLVQTMANAFKRDGHHTTYLSPGISDGMLHGLGHGIGLEVHENPLLSLRGNPLHPNSVIAVEPGLYYKKIGGVRIENNVIVTKKGARSITTLPETIYL